ncbi:tetratricopeptide repeat protein [Streptosporangium subroseum]|uniref:tetratricopeptide repeat protein n=1 Tax=Streptosporangium subroseum TaxID=106412 RepID=UPI00309159C1|nr:tetratricopeptide repeat protein [Streptosporangium subroseum]
MVVAVVLLAAGLVGFFADPLHLPEGLLGVLDQRASVIGMFVGIAGLLVAGAALLAQLRSPFPPSVPVSAQPPAGQIVGGQVLGPGAVSASGAGAVATGSNHGVIVTGDGALITMTSAASRPPLPAMSVVTVPSAGLVGLPRLPSAVFIGRQQDLDVLERTLSAGPGVITQAVVGLGGIGKSELALQYAHHHRGVYRLVWWVAAEDPEQIQAALAALCRALCAGTAPTAAAQATEAEAEAWALAWLAASGGWLVVFDNVEDIDHLQPYLGRLISGHVLITSRRDIGWQELGTVLRLGVLSRPAAVALLLQTIGAPAAFDPALAEELAEELGELPLALKQAGTYIARTPGMDLAGYLRLLRTAPRQALAADPDRSQAGPHRRGEVGRVVARVWAVSGARIAQMDPLAVRVLEVLACYAPDDLPCEVLYGLDGIEETAILKALGLLASYSMINQSPDGRRVSVHRLVQAVTLSSMSEHERAATRAIAAELLQSVLPPDPERSSSWPGYAQLLPHARAVLAPDSPAMESVIDYLDARRDYRTAHILQRHRITALHEKLGPEHPETLNARFNLALWSGEDGDAARARDQFAALVPVLERVLGPEHPNTLTTRANLALYSGKAGDAVGARDQYAALVSVLERVSGSEHPATVTARDNLAFWTKLAKWPFLRLLG